MSNEEGKTPFRRSSNKSVSSSEKNIEQSVNAESQLTDEARVRRRSRRRKRRNQALQELEQIHHEKKKESPVEEERIKRKRNKE